MSRSRTRAEYHPRHRHTDPARATLRARRRSAYAKPGDERYARARYRGTSTLGVDLHPAIVDEIHAGFHRPRTRAECPDVSEDPCPWYGCRHHLGLDVSSAGGMKYRELKPGEPSCALVEAERGPLNLNEIGLRLGGLTRERARQIETRALVKIKLSGNRTGRMLGR